MDSAGAAVDVQFDGTAISWIAVKNSNCGKARVYLDGALAGTVDLYNPTLAWQQRVFSRSGLAAGEHTLRIEWIDEQNAASTDTCVGVDAFDVAGVLLGATATTSRFEQTDARLAYEGSWKTWYHSALSGGDYQTMDSAGAAVDVQFDGTAISWIAVKNSNCGKARVYLDGALAGTVDLYNPTLAWQQRVFTRSGLAAGEHTLRIEWIDEQNAASTDTCVGVDAFDVAGVLLGATATTSRFEQTDARLAYEGSWKTWYHSALSGGDYQTMDSAGAAVDVQFDGTAISWIAVKNSNCGKARVYLDGALAGTVDLYNPTLAWQQRVFTRSGLAAGEHTLRIEWIDEQNAASTDTCVGVDAFDVAGVLLPS